VPVLTLDRVLGDALRGKKALILVDIEGAEFMMLQGASDVLRNDTKPIWMIEISTTEHQPLGSVMNPNFRKTFELLFSEGYQGHTADAAAFEITDEVIKEVELHGLELKTHNFLFR
jgi:hypothetical protein